VMALVLMLVLPLKTGLYYIVLMRFGLRTRTGVLSTLSLTNYSEFGLIVAALAAASGWLSPEWLVVLSLAVAGSFVVAAPLNAAGERVYARFKGPLSALQSKSLLAADQPIAVEQVDAIVLGMGQIGSGAYLRLLQGHGMRVLGVDSEAATLAVHQAAGRLVIEGDAVDSDFWDKLVLTDTVKLVLLAMPGHAGNVYALSQLKNRAFSGRIAAIVQYPEEIEVLRRLGADAVYHVYDEAGTAFADDALAGLRPAT
jgi:glutathione-regulated potassium-efflux system ancillary protein KefC